MDKIYYRQTATVSELHVPQGPFAPLTFLPVCMEVGVDVPIEKKYFFNAEVMAVENVAVASSEVVVPLFTMDGVQYVIDQLIATKLVSGKTSNESFEEDNDDIKFDD